MGGRSTLQVLQTSSAPSGRGGTWFLQLGFGFGSLSGFDPLKRGSTFKSKFYRQPNVRANYHSLSLPRSLLHTRDPWELNARIYHSDFFHRLSVPLCISASCGRSSSLIGIRSDLSVAFRVGMALEASTIVALTLFFSLLCACIIIGHLLRENRWMNESINALIIVRSYANSSFWASDDRRWITQVRVLIRLFCWVCSG